MKRLLNRGLLSKSLLTYVGLSILVIGVAGITYASFSDKGKILGSTFTVGSADLKLLIDVSGGVGASNLADDLPGPSFTGIVPFWSSDHLVKVYNNGSSPINLTTNANYATANDPDELRQIIFVEPFDWNDVNGNGVVDSDEVTNSYGKKTIVKWKTEGFNLGVVESGDVKGLVLRYTTDSVPPSKQGSSGVFDFEFNSLGL
jgi:hypothetical protein